MPAYSRLVTVCSLLLGLNASGLPPAPATPATRPISDAESVLAVYRESMGSRIKRHNRDHFCSLARRLHRLVG